MDGVVPARRCFFSRTDAKIDAKIPFDTFKDLMGSSLEDTAMLDQLTLDDVSLTIIIADGYIEAMELDTGAIDIEGLGEMTIEASYAYADLNEAAVPEFDPSEFDDDRYQAETVYGEYDLTLENGDDLVALGYEYVGEDTYYNGLYIIDLEYKQIANDDLSVIYDWEYDQTAVYDVDMNAICGYDHTLNMYGLGDESVCPLSDIGYLREAYNDIAERILNN